MVQNTDVSICARALILLGEAPISSFDETRDAAVVCANVYPGLRDAILSQHPWRFLMTKKKLTRASETPVGEYSYSHIIPTDAIDRKVHAVFASSKDKQGISNFEVFENRIFSDYEELWADYKITKLEASWPEAVALLMVYAMCAEIAFTITDQQNTADNWRLAAYGLPSDNGMGGQMGIALAQEAQTQGNQSIYANEFIDARHGGTT